MLKGYRQIVKAQDFDSCIGGSNPSAPANDTDKYIVAIWISIALYDSLVLLRKPLLCRKNTECTGIPVM